jgi:thiamine-phosphate pyrophosphorylase
MMRYAITSGDSCGRIEALVSLAARWAEAGVELVQLREKAMEAGELVEAARAMVGVFRAAGGVTKLLVNGRVDVAVAAGADGVHLTGRRGELSPEQVRRVFAGVGREAVVSLSCHSEEDVAQAAGAGANLILFGPVFEKRVDGVLVSSGRSVGMLRVACAAAGDIPVLALGGVTEGNVGACVAAGAAGVAGIRMFEQ